MPSIFAENFYSKKNNANARWTDKFYKLNISTLARKMRGKGEKFWEQEGEKMALSIFHSAAKRVPAYKQFLKKNRVNHQLVKTLSDFNQVPATTKENYIHHYPLQQRVWDGKLFANKITASSSGTSGIPNYWPRGDYQEYEAAVTHEMLYTELFEIQKKSTLLIIGFPMGIYVSGIATLLPSLLVAQKGYNLTIAPTGNSKAEVLKAIRQLSDNFEQTILVGHPFFVKDVIETGKQEGIKWQTKKVKALLCSEGYSEEWRKYVSSELGFKNKNNNVLFNTYGSSELLLTAYENPYTIFVRKLLEKDTDLTKRLFNTPQVPNLFQYNPLLRFIQTIGHELIFTANSGAPLIKFNLHDNGMVLPFNRIKSLLRPADIEPKTPQLSRAWKLPFVALWGRSDHTLVFYAANIYPEHIHGSLHHKSLFPILTGKFSMRKSYLKNMDEFLEINLELRPQASPKQELVNALQERIIDHLKKVNTEYSFLCDHLDKNLAPRIKLFPYQHPKYFKPGLKPRYITD
jgi:phenylacetate-CoA ligase